MEIAELINKLVENQQEFGDIWETLDTDIKEALEKERPETLEKLGEWHNINNDLIEKIFSIAILHHDFIKESREFRCRYRKSRITHCFLSLT